MTACCTHWRDHEWDEPRFLESGRHPTMGRYNRFVVRCQRCPRETIQTQWLDILARPESRGAEGRTT